MTNDTLERTSNQHDCPECHPKDYQVSLDESPASHGVVETICDQCGKEYTKLPEQDNLCSDRCRIEVEASGGYTYNDWWDQPPFFIGDDDRSLERSEQRILHQLETGGRTKLPSSSTVSLLRHAAHL